MNLSVAALGVDIAKLKFDVCLIKENGKAKHKVFANTTHGCEQLIVWLSAHQVGSLHVCLEATGSYGEALALYLFDVGLTVSVVNPAAVKAFAASRLTRTKTDKVDAELIARFCLAQQPEAWQPPAPEVRELQALVRRLESLIEMRVAEDNRLSSGVSTASVRHSLKEHIAYLVEEIKQTELMIREHINNHPDLKEQSDLLDSIPGIGLGDRRAALGGNHGLACNTKVPDKLPLTPDWCRASVAPAVRCADELVYRKSATPGFAKHFTFRQSRLCGAAAFFNSGQRACGNAANAKWRSSARQCGN